MQSSWRPNALQWLAVSLCLFFLAPPVLAAEPPPEPPSQAPSSRETVESLTGVLQRQVASLAGAVGAHLGDESLGPKDVKAIIEVLALQRAVEVFGNLVATHNRKTNQDVLRQNLPWVEQYLQRAEAALAEAPKLRSAETPGPPSAAHPVSIRSTLAEVRHALGLSKQPTFSQLDSVEPPPSLGHLGPEPTESEFQIIQFNLDRLRSAADSMGRGKCYRDFWTRHCADALESHALPHQRRSFVKLLATTRDLLRKYCSSPRLAPLRREYGELLRKLSIRPIVYNYGAGTTPFVDRPGLFGLQCPKSG